MSAFQSMSTARRGSLESFGIRMRTFDLPREKAAFLGCDTWDFSLTENGRDFQVSMDGIAGVPEEEELRVFEAIIARIIERKAEARSAAADRLLDVYNRRWNEAEPISRDEFVGRLERQWSGRGRPR
jgi:hypothetical protein